MKVFSTWDSSSLLAHEGEYPTPSVLNRPYVAIDGVGQQLDEALQFLCRSVALEATENTCFLTHCSDDGKDVVKSLAPVITGGTADDLFISDGFFYGAAYSQVGTTNIITTVDPSLNTLTGWAVTGTSTTGALVSASSDGVSINTMRGQAVAAGTVTVTSDYFSLQAGKTQLTFSNEWTTEQNLSQLGVAVEIGVSFYKSDNSLISSTTITMIPSPYSGVVVKEKAAIPGTAAKAKYYIKVTYPTGGARCELLVKNAMASYSPFYEVFAQTNRAATYAVYSNVMTTAQNAASAVFWAKFPSGRLTSHTNPIGPVFLADGAGVYLGAVHRVASGANFTLSLLLGSGSTITAESSTITLPSAMLDTYLPCIIRYDKTLGTIEFSIVDLNLNLYKCSIAYSALPAQLNLNIGYGGAQTESFGGGVTDVRVDNEWINDFELLVIALARRPFGQSYMAEQGLSDDDIFRLQPANLIPNPQGALGLNHWINYPATNFDIANTSYGHGFLWIGGMVSADVVAQSDLLPVKAGDVYTLYGLVISDVASIGDFGIGVGFYASDGLAPVGMTQTLSASPGNLDTYSMTSVQAPSGAFYAKVYMYMRAGVNSTSILWTRLKFAPTSGVSIFTDDATPGHAVYA